eukprot:jgi/Picsp_1/5346/NSC_02707-R1_hypothetical protein CHLREDRAFT_166746 [Chlamydomonas reinhardtii]
MSNENSRDMKGELRKKDTPEKEQQQQRGRWPKMSRNKQGNTKHGLSRQFGEGGSAILVAKDLGNVWKCMPSCQANQFCVRTFLQGVEVFSREKLGCKDVDSHSEICDGLQDLSLSPSSSGGRDSKTERQAKTVKVSLRLESLQLVDKDIEELCKWVESAKSTIQVKKLWLFGNKITDRSIVQFLAPVVHCMGLVELHLSHNQISTQGATAILTSLAEMYSIQSLNPTKSLWLRLEWNRISLKTLCLALEHLHEKHGFLADMPVNNLDSIIQDEDGNYPGYIRSAAKLASSTSSSLDPACSPNGQCGHGSKTKLRFVLDTCHCRLPWISSQYEKPSESEVIKHARKIWRMACHGNVGPHIPGEPNAPLLVIPDTSSMLSLLSAPASHCTSTFFTLDYLLNLSQTGLFGPSLKMEDQIFLILPSTVSLQLDSLKSNHALRPVISKFMGSILDQIGPSGTNTLHMLGNHEAEGILIESHLDASTVSNEVCFSSTGQRADHRIVETAMYFQLECLKALAQATDRNFNFSSDLIRQKLPVVLLTSDKGQKRLSLHNGLPCISIESLNSRKKEIMRTVQDGKPITSSRMRSWFRDMSTKSLGAFRIRSLQKNFDGSIACLRWLTNLIDDRVMNRNNTMVHEGNPTKPFFTDDELETIAKIKDRLMEWSSLIQNPALDVDTVTKHWDSEHVDSKES